MSDPKPKPKMGRPRSNRRGASLTLDPETFERAAWLQEQMPELRSLSQVADYAIRVAHDAARKQRKS